jgi:hypothetical protein
MCCSGYCGTEGRSIYAPSGIRGRVPGGGEREAPKFEQMEHDVASQQGYGDNTSASYDIYPCVLDMSADGESTGKAVID